jgi:hypothetical protein
MAAVSKVIRSGNAAGRQLAIDIIRRGHLIADAPGARKSNQNRFGFGMNDHAIQPAGTVRVFIGSVSLPWPRVRKVDHLGIVWIR